MVGTTIRPFTTVAAPIVLGSTPLERRNVSWFSKKDTITEGDDDFYGRRETILPGPGGPYPHDPPTSHLAGNLFAQTVSFEENFPWRARAEAPEALPRSAQDRSLYTGR
jgi:hypothetical protein